MIDRKASRLFQFRSCVLLEPLIKSKSVNFIALPLRLVRSGRTGFSRVAWEGSVETHIGLLKWRPAQTDHRVLSEWSATLPLSDYGRVARHPLAISGELQKLCSP
jgi:hypothetical protein